MRNVTVIASPCHCEESAEGGDEAIPHVRLLRSLRSLAVTARDIIASQ